MGILRKESELFEPVKELFIKQGYTADGEVGSIDIFMEKDGLYIAVELKKTLDLKSIEQAAMDQKTCDLVYIGIFTPKNLYSKAFKNKLYILKRLGIGLILVSERTLLPEVFQEPFVSELSLFQKRNKKQTSKLKKEFQERKLKGNIGGVNKTKRMTSYKEESLIVLYHLKQSGGQASPKAIRNACGIKDAAAIMYNNYSGWFLHIEKGLYEISEKGEMALTEYKEELKKLVKA